jgi:hypothetical protein
VCCRIVQSLKGRGEARSGGVDSGASSHAPNDQDKGVRLCNQRGLVRLLSALYACTLVQDSKNP